MRTAARTDSHEARLPEHAVVRTRVNAGICGHGSPDVQLHI